jgi:galactonate dehydratase
VNATRWSERILKITRVNIYLIAIGSLHPVIAEIVTDDGLAGIGEAAIAYGHGGTAAAGMIKDLTPLVLGRDPSRIEEIWSDMYDHSFWAKGGGAIMFAGISALETALWDIKGKALGVPIYELLGGKFRDAVRVYANGWSFKCVSPDDYARAGEKTVRDGYDALKCYPLAVPREGGGIRHVTRRAIDRDAADRAYETIKALRGAVGPDIDIMLDLSGGLTTDETIRLCRRWQNLNILFVEEPADPFDVGALHKISQQVEIPIAVGERLYTRHGFREIFERRAADIVQPDIGNTGGIMETKKIAAMAEAYNMRVQPHICASPVATAAALQIDACIANFMIQELYPYRSAEHFAIVDDAPERHVSRSVMTIPTRPGLGVNLVAEKVRPYLWAECSL